MATTTTTRTAGAVREDDVIYHGRGWWRVMGTCDYNGGILLTLKTTHRGLPVWEYLGPLSEGTPFEARRR